MRKFREWTLLAKTITLSVAGLILSLGLCSVGTKFEQTGTKLQDFAATAGLLLFLAAVIGLVFSVVGVIVLVIGKAIDGDR